MGRHPTSMRTARAGALAFTWLVVGMGSGACIVHPPEGPTAVPARDYPTRRLVLANGVRVLLEEAPDFGAAGAALVVGAGSAADPPGKWGVAHLAEHIVFDATHAGVSFYDWSRNLDGGVNATTNWDTTTYRAFERTPQLPAVLKFLHGVVTEPLVGIDDRVFQREWRAVSNERRLGTEEGTPGQAEGWLIAATFEAGTPYGHDVAGTADSLARVTFEDVRAYVLEHYRPEACTLAVSAPLSLDAQQKMVEAITGQAAAVAASVAPRAFGPRPSSRRSHSFETHEADVATPTLWIGWPVPAEFSEAGDLGPLVTGIAAASAFRELGDRDRDVATLRADVIQGAAASLFFVRVTLKEAAHPADTARMVIDQLQGGLGKLTAMGLSTSHLTQLVATDLVYRQESLQARTLDAAWSFHQIGAPTFLRKRGDRMIGLTYDDVAGYVEEYLKAEQAHVVLVRPGHSGEVEAATRPPAAALVPAAATAAPAPAPAFGITISDADEGRALAGMDARDLANGLRVVVVPRKGSPFHTAVIGFRGGFAQADPPGVVTAAGWGRRWSEESPALNGIDWESRVGLDATYEQLHATGSDVRVTLKHLHRMLRGFSIFWPPREFDKRVEVMEREDRSGPNTFEHRLQHAIYGDQALGTRVTAKQIRHITPGDVNHWIDRVRRPSNAVLVLVGDLDPERAFAAAAAELESWGAGAPPTPPPADSFASDRLIEGDSGPLIQNRTGTKQVEVRLMCLLPKASADNYAAEIVFADSFKRSLLQSWREELGASYTVRGGVDVLPGGSSVLDLAADVDHAQLAPALRRLREMLTPGAAAPGAERLESTRRGTADRFRVETATSGAMAIRILKMWTLRWPIETLDRLPAAARAAGAGEIGKIAEHCRASAVVGMMGDEARLRAAWSGAN